MVIICCLGLGPEIRGSRENTNVACRSFSSPLSRGNAAASLSSLAEKKLFVVCTVKSLRASFKISWRPAATCIGYSDTFGNYLCRFVGWNSKLDKFVEVVVVLHVNVSGTVYRIGGAVLNNSV